MESDLIESDVLCIGGGPTGLMGAIRAAEMGATVVVADKCNTLYSGSGTAGNDHFLCYNPEFHGTDRAAPESGLGQKVMLKMVRPVSHAMTVCSSKTATSTT